MLEVFDVELSEDNECVPDKRNVSPCPLYYIYNCQVFQRHNEARDRADLQLRLRAMKVV